MAKPAAILSQYLVIDDLDAGVADLLFVVIGQKNDVAIEARRRCASAQRLRRGWRRPCPCRQSRRGRRDSRPGSWRRRDRHVHFSRVTPTTSRCASSSSARDGSGMAEELKPADDNSATRRNFKDFVCNAFFFQNSGDVIRRGQFVARRICRVDADQALKPAEGFLRKSSPRSGDGAWGAAGAAWVWTPAAPPKPIVIKAVVQHKRRSIRRASD